MVESYRIMPHPDFRSVWLRLDEMQCVEDLRALCAAAGLPTKRLLAQVYTAAVLERTDEIAGRLRSRGVDPDVVIAEARARRAMRGKGVRAAKLPDLGAGAGGSDVMGRPKV